MFPARVLPMAVLLVLSWALLAPLAADPGRPHGQAAATGLAPRSVPSTYYLAPTGADSAPCSQSQPCKSFATALPLLAPGDTLELAAGTYPQNLNIGTPPVRSGTPEAWITVRGAAAGGTILAPTGIEGATINGNTQYWQLEDLTWDCRALAHPDTGANCVSINWRPGPQEAPEATSHIALRRVAILHTANPSGTASIALQAFANDVLVEDFRMDGTSVQVDDYQGSHCVYTAGSRQVFRRGVITHCGGFGIQMNDTSMSWTQGNRDNQILDVRIEDVGYRASGSRGCLTLYHNQQGTLVAGVTCVRSRSVGFLIEGQASTGHVLVHNTIVGSATRCLSGGSDASHPATALTIQNMLCAGNAQGLKLGPYAGGSSVVANLLSDQSAPESSAGDLTVQGNLVGVDPQFVDAAGGNYQPQATSPACQAGQPVLGQTRDRRGRGTGRTPDIGAVPCVGRVPPEPPEPEPPAGGRVLACTGTLSAVPGAVSMTCVQHPAR